MTGSSSIAALPLAAPASYRFFEFFTARPANPASMRATQLHDRRSDGTALDEAGTVAI